jgi:DNA-directed RNA polymerase
MRSPDPEQFLSQVPVQMDGSCNGLQHYAALGRDNLGALHVNLLPTAKPMDVYTGVLNVVKKNIEIDAKVTSRLS